MFVLTEEGEQGGVIAVRREAGRAVEDVVTDHPGVGTFYPGQLVSHVTVGRGHVEEDVFA